MEGVDGIGVTLRFTTWLTADVQPLEMALTEYEPADETEMLFPVALVDQR